MHWNYRIVNHRHRFHGKWICNSSVEEVYYDEDGAISHTADLPVGGDDRAEVLRTLKMMLRDCAKSPSVPCRCERKRKKKLKR